MDRSGGVIIVLALALGACSAGGPEADPAAPSLITAASPSSTVAPTRAVVPKPGEPWMAYEDSQFRIRLVRPDGTDDHVLDDVTTGAEDNPDWSPDGTRLTFVGEGSDGEGSAAGLWVINADGTGLTKVVDCVAPCRFLDDPAWSPDGSQIMYTRLAPDSRTGGRLEVVDVATRTTRTILAARAGQSYSGVRYAPDGTAVVLEWLQLSARDYDQLVNVQLALVDLTSRTARLTTLTGPTSFPELPDWSPEGDLIVYAAHPKAADPGYDLFLVHPDGTGRRRLTTLTAAGGGASHADFTADGSAVVFLGADAAGSAGFMRVDLATGTVSPAFAAGRLSGHHPRSRPVP